MTSIEWLVDQMFKQGYFDGNKPLTFTNLDHLQQQAKEMHKQEIIDALNEQSDVILSDEFCNNYYQETFVSKGSDNTLKDYHIVDTNEMVELPQQEISDEEIEKAVKNPMHDAYDFREGAKWYREQLKK